MLWQRVMTAVVLLAVLIPCLLATPVWPVAAMTAVAVTVAAWEWARLNRAGSAAAVGLAVLLAAVSGVMLFFGLAQRMPTWIWWVSLVVWVCGGMAALHRGVPAWAQLPRAFRLALGAVILISAWSALACSKGMGINYLLSVLCLVWVADIAAYFGGKALGRHKLAPSISPGKTWEGVFSGMLSVLLLAAIWLAVDSNGWGDGPSLYSRVHAAWGWPGMALSVVFLVAMSVVGDLFESLIKRSVGAKDSGTALPGHGGVLDRVDALLPVLPIALALAAGAA